jgi:hypothetical protein
VAGDTFAFFAISVISIGDEFQLLKISANGMKGAATVKRVLGHMSVAASAKEWGNVWKEEGNH